MVTASFAHSQFGFAYRRTGLYIDAVNVLVMLCIQELKIKRCIIKLIIWSFQTVNSQSQHISFKSVA